MGALLVTLRAANAQDVFIPASRLRGSASASNYQPEEALAKNTSLPNGASPLLAEAASLGSAIASIDMVKGAAKNTSLPILAAPSVDVLEKNQSLPNMTATELEASYRGYYTSTCGGTSYGSACRSSFYYKFSYYAPVDMGWYYRGCATADHDRSWCYTTN